MWVSRPQLGCKDRSTLAPYSLSGAGIGALLGTAAATIPWLTSRQIWDFITGSGAGAVVGTGVGFIGGIIDLATETSGDEEEQTGFTAPGLLAWGGAGSGGFLFAMHF